MERPRSIVRCATTVWEPTTASTLEIDIDTLCCRESADNDLARLGAQSRNSKIALPLHIHNEYAVAATTMYLMYSRLNYCLGKSKRNYPGIRILQTRRWASRVNRLKGEKKDTKRRVRVRVIASVISGTRMPNGCERRPHAIHNWRVIVCLDVYCIYSLPPRLRVQCDDHDDRTLSGLREIWCATGVLYGTHLDRDGRSAVVHLARIIDEKYTKLNRDSSKRDYFGCVRCGQRTNIQPISGAWNWR